MGILRWTSGHGLKCPEPLRRQYSLTSIFQQGTNHFLYVDNHQGKTAFETTVFSWGDQFASKLIRLKDFLIIEMTGKDQLISKVFCTEIITKGS